MNEDRLESGPGLLQELGRRIASLRLQRNWTQARLAQEAGVAPLTISSLETGKAAAQLSVFLRVCQALGILSRLDAFIPTVEPRPMELLKLKNKHRKRATGSRKVKAEPPKKWTWGDDDSR